MAKRVILVFIIAGIIAITFVNYPSAAVTSVIVVFIVVLTEGCIFVTGVIIPIDPLSAAGTECGFFLCTAFAQGIIPHHHRCSGNDLPAMAAGSMFSHRCQSPL